jgi:broad specificity phosphatase PhoE
MDPKLKAFLELVDCRPEEVKDIPLDRPLTTDMLKAECDHIDPQARHQSLGEMEAYFGKHKGKKLKDIPRQYLEWAVGERPTTNSFRRFQRRVTEFLSCVADSPSNVEASPRRQAM